MPRNGLLVAAEHEAAHGVCAASLGVPVVRLAVFANGGGECIRGFTAPDLSAVISCGPRSEPAWGSIATTEPAASASTIVERPRKEPISTTWPPLAAAPQVKSRRA